MKLFRKKTDEPQYSDVIEMVHNEFNSAGEKLYQDALKIINSSRLLNEEKVKELKRLGFTSTKEVQDAEKILKERKLNEETVANIEYYRTNYPLNKFITEKQIKDICKKYGLVFGEIHLYTGFVPEHNLKCIADFKINEKDVAIIDIDGNQLTRDQVNHYYKRKAEASMEFNELQAYRSYQTYEHHRMRFSDVYRSRVQLDKILIAAPAKDFKITDKHIIKKFRIFNKPVPDPVVLAPVIGGYLIVTAWGDEASDPIVQNEINN